MVLKIWLTVSLCGRLLNNNNITELSEGIFRDLAQLSSL